MTLASLCSLPRLASMAWAGPLGARGAAPTLRAVWAPDDLRRNGARAMLTDEALPEPSDAELVARIVGGDERAFAAAYDRHASVVFGSVVRFLGDREAAEEVVQETYLRLWQRAQLYVPSSGSLVGWLLAIARNRAIDRLRAAARRPQTLTGWTRAGDEPTEDEREQLFASGHPLVEERDDSPEALATQAWTRAVVRAAIVTIPPLERRALELAYDDGLSQAEIAAELNWPLGTVKTRTRRALARLREALEGVPDLAPVPTVAAIARGGPVRGPREGTHGPR